MDIKSLKSLNDELSSNGVLAEWSKALASGSSEFASGKPRRFESCRHHHPLLPGFCSILSGLGEASAHCSTAFNQTSS